MLCIKDPSKIVNKAGLSVFDVMADKRFQKMHADKDLERKNHK